MKSRFVLFVSIFISAFILLSAAGIALAMSNPNVNPPQQNVASTVQPAAQDALVRQFSEREAAYQKLVADANQRIETLNNEVTALQQKSTQASADPAVTADKAAQIAINAAGENEALQSMPELVSYQGTSAFEVDLNDGKVYIDAQTGQVLFDGVVKPITSQQAGEIAGKYLGGMNPKYAVIKLINFNGTQIYQVTFSGDKDYVVFVDLKGTVLKAQIYQYTGGGGGGGSQTSSTGGGERGESDHESD
jgi:uncharacterized membrane protein YkoI